MFITLRASDGYIITDGENYGTTFDLAEGRTPDDYREITKAEYEEVLKAEETSE